MHSRTNQRRRTCGRGILAVLVLALAGAGPARGAETAPPPKVVPQPVFESELNGFTEKDYAAAVDAMFTRYEQLTGRRLAPGAKGKVGLKIYSDSGPGLATPIPLVEAVIAALQQRGFKPGNIFLVGLSGLRMRFTGTCRRWSPARATSRAIPSTCSSRASSTIRPGSMTARCRRASTRS